MKNISEVTATFSGICFCPLFPARISQLKHCLKKSEKIEI